MPNAKVLEAKKKTVEEMTQRLKSKSGVFVDYRGITGIEATAMRAKLRAENVQYSVIKNSLMRFAVKNVGFDELGSMLTGTTSLATSDEDPIAPARIIKEYADKLPDYFEIKAGFMDGRLLSKEEVTAIASIPPLPVLQAQFLGTLLAPISKLAAVLKAIAEKDGSTAEDGKEEKKPGDTEADAKETVKAEDEKVEAAAEVKPEEAKSEAVAEVKPETEVQPEKAETPEEPDAEAKTDGDTPEKEDTTKEAAQSDASDKAE